MPRRRDVMLLSANASVHRAYERQFPRAQLLAPLLLHEG